MAKTEGLAWEELNKKTDRCVIVCLMMRPGSRLFSAKLEYTHYPPRSDRNKEYEYCIGHWKGTMFVGVSLPKEDKHLADEVAASLGMRLEEEQVLLLCEPGGVAEFPAKGPHVFHLSGGYQGDEQAALDAIFASDEPHRKSHIMDNARIALTPPDWIDRMMADMNMYMPECPKFVQRMVETRPQIVETLVAYLDKDLENDMLGFLTVCRDEQGHAYVGIIYTHPEVRQCGVAGFLIKAAIMFCMRQSLGSLRIQSRHAHVNKILAHFPPEMAPVVKVEILGDDLSVEQERAEAERKRRKEKG